MGLRSTTPNFNTIDDDDDDDDDDGDDDDRVGLSCFKHIIHSICMESVTYGLDIDLELLTPRTRATDPQIQVA